MNHFAVTNRSDRMIEAMIALARCSKLQRIIVAGSNNAELMFELERRGYVHAAATANRGRSTKQYDVALVDWRRRTLRALEMTLDWLVDFLSPGAVLVVWTDPQKTAARENLFSILEERGFVIEDGAVQDDGYAVSARQHQVKPIHRAA